MFCFWDILYLTELYLDFSCEKTFFNITHDRKIILKLPPRFIFVYDHFKDTFLLFSKNIDY